MRRRFFAIGYVFFALLTATGLIMIFAFVARLSTKPALSTDELVEHALSDTVSLQADQAFFIENIGHDLCASLKNFHYYSDIRFIEPAHRSNCLSCHTPLPHNKEIRTRAFLNMHGNFIACQTCHTRDSEGEYHWYDLERNTIADAYPGNVPVMAVQLVREHNGRIDLEKESDSGFLREYTQEVKNDRLKQEQLCKDKYRNDLDSVLRCDHCHSAEHVVMKWNTLGYSQSRVLELRTLSIPSVFQKYDKFYIPSF